MQEEPKLYWIDGHVYLDVDVEKYPQALLLTREQALAIEAGTHTVINGGVVPIPTFEPTLEELKAAKFFALEEEYTAARERGVNVTINGSVYKFRAMPESIAKVTSGDSFAQKLVARGITEPIPLEPVSGAVQILPSEYDDFSFYFGLATEVLRGQYMAKKSIIEQATSKETLEAIDVVFP